MSGIFSLVFLTEGLLAESCYEKFSSVYVNETSVYKGGRYNASSRGFRFNDINPVLMHVADIFDTRYFDLLTGRDQSTYLWHNSGLTLKENFAFFSKVDDFFTDYIRELLFERVWSDETNVFLDPDICRYVTVTLMKIFLYTRGFHYIDIGGQIVWIINRDGRDTPAEHTVFWENPIIWSVVQPQVRKRLTTSILMYYSLKLGKKTPHIPNAKMALEKQILSLDSLYYTKEEFLQKKQKYELRVKNIKNIEQVISGIKSKNDKEKPLISKVHRGYFINIIKKWEFYDSIVESYPYLEEQDLGFMVKFFMNSVYKDDFTKYLKSKLTWEEFCFIMRWNILNTLSDLDQIVYIGPYCFSLKQIFTVLYRDKNIALNSKEIVRALRNLLGEGWGKIDTDKVMSQIEENIEKEEVLSPATKEVSNEDSFLDFFYNKMERSLDGLSVIKLFVSALDEKDNLDILELSLDEAQLVKMYLRNKGFIKLDKLARYQKY